MLVSGDAKLRRLSSGTWEVILRLVLNIERIECDVPGIAAGMDLIDLMDLMDGQVTMCPARQRSLSARRWL